MAKMTGSQQLSAALSAKTSRQSSQAEPSANSQTKGQETKSQDDVPWEHDEDNPLNWPTWKRVFHTAVPACIAFIWYAESDLNDMQLSDKI